MNSDQEQTVFWFGKYKGVEIAHVARIDPQYLSWALRSGALHKSQLPKAVGRQAEEVENDLQELEDNLANYFGDRDVPHETTRIVPQREVDMEPEWKGVHRLPWQTANEAMKRR